jgi:hypothetical protein
MRINKSRKSAVKNRREFYNNLGKRSSVARQKKTKRLLEILPKIRIIPTILEETEDYFGIFSFLI